MIYVIFKLIIVCNIIIEKVYVSNANKLITYQNNFVKEIQIIVENQIILDIAFNVLIII